MVSVGGRNIGIEIENTYDYLGQTFYNAEDFTDFLNYNLKMASNIENYKTDIESIANEIVAIARNFVISNGTYKTGRLHDSIHWEPQARGIRLTADAKDGESHYAGHIEYGFVGRDGLPKGPWPFLRPAMRIGAEASTGQLADHMASNILYGIGNSSFLSFGRHNVASVLSAAGGRNHVLDQVRSSYGGSRSQFDRLIRSANTTRWKQAGHGINYTNKIKPNSDEERIFNERFGPAMSQDRFREGHL